MKIKPVFCCNLDEKKHITLICPLNMKPEQAD